MSAALGAAPHDLAEVEAIVRAAGTSFYRGMRVLPPDRRAAMYAIYAFCRIVDDIADDEDVPAADDRDPLDAKRHALDDWRARIAALYHADVSLVDASLVDDGPVPRVLRRAVDAFALREVDFRDVIDGMQMDATAIVAPELATLDLYCDRVAASVGRLSVRAFGDASPMADQVAYALGRALQLTNVLRDVAEDAARGRLYLPREYLDDAGVPHDPAAALAHPALHAVCVRLAVDAHAQFAAAAAAMRRCDRRAMRPARLMGATYAAVLARLERRGWVNPEPAVKLPKLHKIWIALRYGLL